MNKNGRSPRLLVAALAVMVALVTAIGAAPTQAVATEATPGTIPDTLYTVESCPQCGGLPHDLHDMISRGSIGPFTNAYTSWSDPDDPDWQGLSSCVSEDPSIVSVSYDEALDEYTLTAGTKTGTTYVTLIAKTGEVVTTEVNVVDAYENIEQYAVNRGSGRGDVEEARAYLDTFHFVALEGISFDGEEAVISTSRTEPFYMPYYCQPENASRITTFSVSDPSVLSVQDYGTFLAITPLKAGTATITLTATDQADQDVKFADTLTITVVDESQPTPEPEPEQTVLTNEQGATLVHETNGVSGSDAFWSGLSLVTDHLGGDVAQAATDSVVAVVDGVTGHPYVFDIHLEDIVGDVFEIPEGDSVTVTLPIPEGLSAEGLRVFHVADDGAVTDMGATVDAEAGTVSFTTTHFSTFVLANVEDDGTGQGSGGQTTKPAGEKADGLAKTGDPGALPALLAAASGSAALLGSRALKKRR